MSVKQRLYVLEKKSAEEGLVLTKLRLRLRTQIGGTIKGAGSIYQQTFADICSK